MRKKMTLGIEAVEQIDVYEDITETQTQECLLIIKNIRAKIVIVQEKLNSQDININKINEYKEKWLLNEEKKKQLD